MAEMIRQGGITGTRENTAVEFDARNPCDDQYFYCVSEQNWQNQRPW